MAETRMLTVFAYDIVRDRARAKVAAILEERMLRVQDSVFEARLTERETERLFARVSRLLADEDRLRVWAVAAAGRGRCRAKGGAPLPEEGGFLIL